MGMSPELFGPYFWGTLHLACLGTKDLDKLREFVNLYKYVMPCGSCCTHFATVLDELPFPESTDPLVLFGWSVDVHNIVNRRLGKPEMSMEQALRVWTEPKKDFTIFYLWALAILVLTVIFLILNK